MKVDEFKDQLQILKNTNESNKKTIFNMSNSKLTIKKLLNKIITNQELPSYLKELKTQKFFRENTNSRTWDFEQIFNDTFNNKEQKVGDTNKIGSTGKPFRQFDNLQALKQTLPTAALRRFSEIIAKHQIILPSALPAHIDHSTYSFDWNSSVLSGPFIDDHFLLIEQQQTDRPLFQIVWIPNNSECLFVYIFNPSDKSKRLYSVCIGTSQALLFDYTTDEYLYRYNVNSDGSLGNRTK